MRTRVSPIRAPSAERGHSLALLQAPPPDACPVTVYLYGLAPRSRVEMRRCLDLAASVITDGVVDEAVRVDWSQVRYSHAAKVLGAFRDRYAPEGVRVKLSALKQVLKSAWRLGLLDAETYFRAVDLPKIRSKPLQRGRALTEAETDALLTLCDADRSLRGRRDAALFALFAAGMRVSELLGVDVADYDGGTILIRHGKGDVARYAYIGPRYVAIVHTWLEHRGSKPGPLICGILGNSKLVLDHPMTISAVTRLCWRRAEKAGVKRFATHDFRRTTATRLKAQKTDLADIKDFLGHQSIKTTEMYFRNDKEASKRAAARRLAGERDDGTTE